MKPSKQAAAIAEKSRGAAGKPTMNIEQADDGSLISRTGRTNDSYDRRPVTKTHANSNALMSHIKATFPPKATGKTPASTRALASKTPTAWSGVANQMLASGVAGPNSSNGGR